MQCCLLLFPIIHQLTALLCLCVFISGSSPVEMFLHHFGDGARHSLLLRCQALVKASAQPLLQEVDNEFSATHLLLVVLNPGHLPLW